MNFERGNWTADSDIETLHILQCWKVNKKKCCQRNDLFIFLASKEATNDFSYIISTVYENLYGFPCRKVLLPSTPKVGVLGKDTMCLNSAAVPLHRNHQQVAVQKFQKCTIHC